MGIGVEEKEDGVHKLHGYEINNVNNKLGAVVDAFGDNVDVDNPLQILSAIDQLNKQTIYSNVGTDNDLELTRQRVIEDIEVLRDNMTVQFKATGVNTGPMTLVLNHLGGKALMLNGAAVPNGFTAAGVVYLCTYNVVDDVYELQTIAGTSSGNNGGGGGGGIEEIELNYYTGDGGIVRISQPKGLSGEIGEDENVLLIQLPYSLKAKEGKSIILSFQGVFHGKADNLMDGTITISKQTNSDVLEAGDLSANVAVGNKVLNKLLHISSKVDDDNTYLYLEFATSLLGTVFITTEVVINEDTIDAVQWQEDAGISVLPSTGSPLGTINIIEREATTKSGDTLTVNQTISELIAGGSAVGNIDPDVTTDIYVYTNHVNGPMDNSLIKTNWLSTGRLTVNKPAMYQQAFNFDENRPRYFARIRKVDGSDFSSWRELPNVNFGADLQKDVGGNIIRNSSFAMMRFTDGGGTKIHSNDVMQAHGGGTGNPHRKAFYDIFFSVTSENIHASEAKALLLTSNGPIYLGPGISGEVTKASFTIIRSDGVYTGGGLKKLATEEFVIEQSNGNAYLPMDKNYSSRKVVPNNDVGWMNRSMVVENTDETPISEQRYRVGDHFRLVDKGDPGDNVDNKRITVGNLRQLQVTGGYSQIGTNYMIDIEGNANTVIGYSNIINADSDVVHITGYRSNITVVGLATDSLYAYHGTIQGDGKKVGMLLALEHPDYPYYTGSHYGFKITGDDINVVDGDIHASKFYVRAEDDSLRRVMVNFDPRISLESEGNGNKTVIEATDDHLLMQYYDLEYTESVASGLRLNAEGLTFDTSADSLPRQPLTMLRHLNISPHSLVADLTNGFSIKTGRVRIHSGDELTDVVFDKAFSGDGRTSVCSGLRSPREHSISQSGLTIRTDAAEYETYVTWIAIGY